MPSSSIQFQGLFYDKFGTSRGSLDSCCSLELHFTRSIADFKHSTFSEAVLLGIFDVMLHLSTLQIPNKIHGKFR